MIVSKEQIKTLLRSNSEAEQWLDAVNKILPKYKINTTDRIAAFFAQTAYESRDFTLLEENLNYSAKALDAVFAKYFKKSGVSPHGYARNPKKIANYVYGNRMENGDVESGDGWRFRGRGVIQLTGKRNYRLFAEAAGMTLAEVIPYLETKQGALEGACWFWATNDLNKLADRADIEGISRRVNGGTNGLASRKKLYKQYVNVLTGVETYMPSKRGDRGDHVKQVQAKLGVPVDGDFGPTTLAAVKKFQIKNGLTADGIVGLKTLKVMFGG